LIFKDAFLVLGLLLKKLKETKRKTDFPYFFSVSHDGSCHVILSHDESYYRETEALISVQILAAKLLNEMNGLRRVWVEKAEEEIFPTKRMRL